MAIPVSTAVDIHELESHRQQLFKFAMLQLRDESRAEDAVQETMEIGRAHV